MRILHVLDHSVPLQSGYAFRTLAILAEQRARGWDTIQLTSPKHHLPYASPEEAVDGWRFLRTKPLPRFIDAIPLVREYATALATARRLAQAVDAAPPDILHAHSPVLNAIAALRIGRRRSLPVVYEIRAFWEDAAASHGTFSDRGPIYRLARAMETRAVRRADAVTVICDGLRRDLIARGIPEAKVTVIPNAVDPHAFGDATPDRALAARLGLDRATVLGFLGSFYSYEGLHLLIEALPRILAARPEVRVLLVGGGPEDGNLRALAGRLGLADKVVFTGRVPHGEVERYYALVDVLVYPRLSMRLTELVTPLKPLEAMAEGKIVVASDVGGHRELIRDGETGSLFRAGDVAALADTVLVVLGRRGEWPAQRARGRRFVETERSWAASVARYEPVYARLIAARG